MRGLDKVALVTRAGTGIGRQAALALLQEGYAVVLSGRRPEPLQNTATEMTARMQHGVPQAHGAIEVEPTMDAEHVARAVVYMASLPLDANVLFMTVMATKMPFIGRG